MLPSLVALVSFACLFAGAMLGMLLQNFLPKHHLSAESKDIIKLGAALIATMAALVLGLLVSSAKSSFDSINNGLTHSGAKFIVLDNTLKNYGPETQSAREDLRESVEAVYALIWPEEGGKAAPEAQKGRTRMYDLADKIKKLEPVTDAQKELRKRASDMCFELAEARWVLMEQEQQSLPLAFLVVLLLWLSVLNLIYGIFAPRNPTVVAVFAACALSVSGAIFLIFEMSRPLEGQIKVSSAPIKKALEFIGK